MINTDQILAFYKEKEIPFKEDEIREEEPFFWYLGANCYVFCDGTSSFLIDPYLSRNASNRKTMRTLGPIHPKQKKVDELYQYIGAPFISHILTTHNHYDHVFDLASLSRSIYHVHKTYPQILGTDATQNIATGLGLKKNSVTYVDYNESIDIGKFHITFLPGKHSSIYPFYEYTYLHRENKTPLWRNTRSYRYMEGHMFDILIEHKSGRSLLLVGSFNHGNYSLDKPINTLLLAVGGEADKTKKYKEELYQFFLELAQPNKVLLGHYDDFKIDWNQPMKFIRSNEKIRILYQKITPDIPINYAKLLYKNKF